MINKLNINSVVKIKQGLTSGKIDDELILFNIEKGEYHGLNETGTFIMENMKEEVVVKDMIELLLKEFNIDKNTCEKETLNYLNKIYQKGLVEIIK